METRRFGKTDMEITSIGFGSWSIGGGRRPEQVDGIIGAAELRLSNDELDRIEGFLDENP